MKDFSLIDGSSGSFPDVVAVDCSGPGEVDGFAIISDYLNDSGLGWIQALLNDVGATPNGSTESDGASQILDAIKLCVVPKIYHPGLFVPEWDGSNLAWKLSTNINRIESVVNDAGAILQIHLPIGTLDTEFTVRVVPGSARTGTDRMKAYVYKQTRTGTTPSIVGSAVYDNGTTGVQDLVVTNNSVVVAADEMYWLCIQGGNDGASNTDEVRCVTADLSFS